MLLFQITISCQIIEKSYITKMNILNYELSNKQTGILSHKGVISINK